MKTNAIVRIVLFSLAILILLGILVTGIVFGLFMHDTEFSQVSTHSDNQVLPTGTDGMITQSVADASSIQNLDIEWVSGSILIQPDSSASNITLSETYVDNTKYQMVCKQSGNTLKIQYCEESISFPSFGINIDFSKDLVITVPASWVCGSLNVDAASANVMVNDLTIGEADFDSASGTCVFENCTVGALDLDTASGDVDFTGVLDTLDYDAASASCNIVVSNTPKKIDIDTASGDLDLTLPEECGFSCNLDSMNGGFTSDFPTTISDAHHVYGDGSCHINISAMSGDVYIRKHGGSAALTDPANSAITCTDPTCTDESHDHTETCTVPNCTDKSHHHSSEHHE